MQQNQPSETLMGRMQSFWQQVIAIVGWACIILGIAGALLPILPAWPFLLPGVILLGPRNRRLRLAACNLRLALRRYSRSDHRAVSLVARGLSFQERALRQTLGPLITRWAAPAAGTPNPLRYLVLLLPPLALAFTAFLVVKLMAALAWI